MRKWSTILSLCVAALFAGCNDVDLSEDFQTNDQLRLEIKGYVTFSYDPLTCQLGFNRDLCEFRVHSDNMSDFFSLKLDEMPASMGQKINGTASWTTGDDFHNKKTTFEVVRIEHGKIWLWSPDSRIAAVVQELY